MPTLTLDLVLSRTSIRRPEQLVAEGTVTNTDANPLVLYTVPLSSPSLAIRLRTASGAEIPPPPPPMPVEDDGVSNRVLLNPGESYSVTYTNFLPDRLPSGRYEVALRYQYDDDVQSPWARFRLKP